MHLHQFPVPGPHSFGGPDDRFGAPRSGHIHQGQDIPAACGEKLYAFERGQVRVNAYQAGGAGYYIVIHGIAHRDRSVYMHMKAPSWAPRDTGLRRPADREGRRERVTRVGCHLHFERCSVPGWYVGGAPYDPLPELQYWDIVLLPL